MPVDEWSPLTSDEAVKLVRSGWSMSKIRKEKKISHYRLQRMLIEEMGEEKYKKFIEVQRQGLRKWA